MTECRKVFHFIAGICLVGLLACTKKIDLEPISKNKITEYKVTNLPEGMIYGAIDNIENTITVYLPLYYGMTVIDPQISLEEGATLTEAVAPIAVTDTTKTYTIVGSDESTRKYKLVIVVSNAFPLNLAWAPTLGNTPAATPGSAFVVLGDFASTSTAALSVTFVNLRTGKPLRPDPAQPLEIQDLSLTQSDLPQTFLLRGYLPVEADSGSYSMRIDYFGQTDMPDQPLQIFYPTPELAPIFGKITAARNSLISFNASGSSLLINPTSVTATVNGNTYTLPIDNSSNRKKLVIKVPAEFPLGDLGEVPFVFKFGEWEPININISFLITQ